MLEPACAEGAGLTLCLLLGRRIPPMSKAIALTRNAVRHSADHARLAIVLACAAALIMAGQALPF